MHRTMSLIAVLLLAAIGSVAQTSGSTANTTRISGKVTDLDGKPVAGIALTIKDLKTNEQVTVLSNKEGRFSAEGLEQGDYSVAVNPLLVPARKGIRLRLEPAEPSPRSSGAKKNASKSQ